MERANSIFKFGYYISFATAILTLVTFAMAILTPPFSGPLCEAGCFQYPYTDILSRFPRDYYWMYPAMILVLFYLAMTACIHQIVPANKKHFSLISVAFSVMATLILFTDYFIQVSVIQPSLLAGETEGISILSQFNPHGIFIVLEEIGFVFMSISFFCYVPIFTTEKAIKWTSMIGFFLTIISFIIITFIYGINREYRFELAVISIVWTELIVLSFLLKRYFKKTAALP